MLHRNECNNKGHRIEIVGVLKDQPTAKSSVFVTSRPHTQDIGQCFKGALRIDLEASEQMRSKFCSNVKHKSM